jgi:hypothetical protein
MRLSRLVCGIVAGIVGILSVIVVQSLETRFLGGPIRETLWVAFLSGGGVVLWLADHFGLLAPPYTKSTLGLAGDESSDRDEAEKR